MGPAAGLESRCPLPAAGKPWKQPWLFQLRSGETFWLGGLCERWVGPVVIPAGLEEVWREPSEGLALCARSRGASTRQWGASTRQSLVEGNALISCIGERIDWGLLAPETLTLRIRAHAHILGASRLTDPAAKSGIAKLQRPARRWQGIGNHRRGSRL